MALGLVAYTDSDSDDSATPLETKPSPPSSSRKRKHAEDHDAAASNGRPRPSTTILPALPAAFHDLYSAPVRTHPTSDPSLHGGRQRQIPHVEGNWNTHVYIEWHPPPSLHPHLSTLLTTLAPPSAPPIHPFHLTPLHTPAPLHISLSAPLILRTPNRAPFLAAIAAAIARTRVRPFDLRPTRLRWVANRDASRWFLAAGLAVADSTSEGDPSPDSPAVAAAGSADGAASPLLALLDAANTVARARGLPELYTDTDTDDTTDADRAHRRWSTAPAAALHVSLGWRLARPPNAQEVEVPVASDAGQAALAALRRVRIRVVEVKVRIGGDVHRVPLGGRTARGASLFGV